MHDNLNPGLPLSQLHAAFQSIVPRIERHGRFYFRHVRCHAKREDAIADMVAFSWKWFVQLVERGKDPLAFVSRIADFAARHVRRGRRLHGQDTTRDAMSWVAQQRAGFEVESLSSVPRASHEERYSRVNGQDNLDAWEDRLRENHITPVLDQVAFRIDFGAWLETLTARDREMVGAMAQSERTFELSRRFELTTSRISQLRRELYAAWDRFCGQA
jgi:hypothetical protein